MRCGFLPTYGKRTSIRVVRTRLMMIEIIIGLLKYDERNAATTPTRPAYQEDEKSVSESGNIKHPRAAIGSNSMHFRIVFGRESSVRTKSGNMRGTRVTAEHTAIIRYTFIRRRPPRQYI